MLGPLQLPLVHKYVALPVKGFDSEAVALEPLFVVGSEPLQVPPLTVQLMFFAEHAEAGSETKPTPLQDTVVLPTAQFHENWHVPVCVLQLNVFEFDKLPTTQAGPV